MKNVFLTVIFAFSCAYGYAQTGVCCPYVGDVVIIPAVPTSTDNIRVATATTTPNLGSKISYQHVIIGDTIFITGCYFSGFFTALQLFQDTANIGRLANGNYVVKYVAIQSYNADSCLSNASRNTQTLNKSFRVQNRVGTSEINKTIENQLFSVYPNPTNDVLRIQTEQPNAHYQLFNIIGQMVAEQFFDNATSIVMTALPRGEYLLKVSANGQAATKKIVKN